MASGIFASLFRRAPQAPANPIHFPYTAATNPFAAKRTWPPDFSKLSKQHQFRLERRYRRRTKLKWARPNWTKAVKLTQWGTILFVCVYGALYLDMGQEMVRGTDRRFAGRKSSRGWQGQWSRSSCESQEARRMNGFSDCKELASTTAGRTCDS
ncbi:hypothetical protein BTJ68_01422 [Hortaea werneckii EXF-2000]|uniref:Uncharacterized protein n=1 Tax=Hortaea werneckii EXF-2000 TaxID=1157616 RepID=A0A1Z5TSD6_HORWE|nr:hypothetical protein BTJ68_01422 [Hortaea werneckii EXF-2000]